MGKLCIIYNFAPNYRKGIFPLIDRNFDCEWYFGDNKTDIKGMDLSLLKSVNTMKNIKIYNSWYWQKGTISLLFRKDIDKILSLGELYNLSTWALMLLKPIISPKKKIYLWSHGWYGRESKLKKCLKRLFFSLPNGSFFYGNHAKKIMEQSGGDVSKVWVIHNSLDYDTQLSLRKSCQNSNILKSHFNNDNPNLIFIGRLTNSKKLHLAIDAVNILREKGIYTNLTLVGDGEAKGYLDNYSREKNIPVWFYGPCYDEQINACLISSADICISPGNVGLTSIHSMMFGTPVITHDNFSNQGPEFEAISHNKTGLFFKENSSICLAEAISNWLQSNTDREKVRKDCFKEIDSSWNPSFQLDIIKKHILETIYE